MFGQLKHIQSRRADLRQHIEIEAAFEEWEESCVPSYCHKNPLAAYVSWLRLFRAVAMARKNFPAAKRALDFGSSVGELGHMLVDNSVAYEFIEQDEAAAAFLKSRLPGAVRHSLDTAPEGSYDWIFAIDSLEHNDAYAELVSRLSSKLSPSGLLILSGPTENRLYRLGRSIAGYDGHYHTTTIYEIEKAAAQQLSKIDASTIIPGAPLFRLSAWSKP